MPRPFLLDGAKINPKQVGCVIIGPDREIRATGYNGFPRGVNNEVAARHERPAKYFWSEHAERNAVFNAARVGVSTKDCSAYVNWYPCADCSRALIQAGIKQLYCPEPNWSDERWREHFYISKEMLALSAGLVADRSVDTSVACIAGNGTQTKSSAASRARRRISTPIRN